MNDVALASVKRALALLEAGHVQLAIETLQELASSLEAAAIEVKAAELRAQPWRDD